MATQAEPITKTRTMHVPADVHKRISVLAAERETDKQEITAQALRLGLAQMLAADEAASHQRESSPAA